MEDMGNTHMLPDRQGGNKWEILISFQKAKKGGHGKYLLVARQPGGGGNWKYSVVARQPRREDMGNTH